MAPRVRLEQIAICLQACPAIAATSYAMIFKLTALVFQIFVADQAPLDHAVALETFSVKSFMNMLQHASDSVVRFCDSCIN